MDTTTTNCTIRKPMHFVMQQLGDSARMATANATQNGSSQGVDTTGLNLTPIEARVVEAFHVALHLSEHDKTIPIGYFITEHVAQTDAFVSKGQTLGLPTLIISEPQLLEFGGWQRKGNGRFHDKHKNQLREALQTLHKNHRIMIYKRSLGRGENKTAYPVNAKSPLIARHTTINDKGTLPEGGDPRATWYEIILNPIFIDQIESFHFFQPIDLLAQIEAARAKIRGGRVGRPTDHERLFIMFLLTLNKNVSLRESAMIQKMRLNPDPDNRHWERIKSALQQAVDVAVELEIILDYAWRTNERGQSVLDLTINPARSSRMQFAIAREEQLAKQKGWKRGSKK